jgi:hypothetical protein
MKKVYITGLCTKCEKKVIFDVCFNENYIEEAEKALENHEFGHCVASFHVEIGKMVDYYILDYSKVFEIKKDAEKYIPFENDKKDIIKKLPLIKRNLYKYKVDKDTYMDRVFYDNGLKAILRSKDNEHFFKIIEIDKEFINKYI